MMPNSVVLDTNLIFSALIPKASQIRAILLEKYMSFYAPNYLIAEIYRHKTRIVSFSKLSESEFYLYFNGVIERINFIPTDFIGTESRQKAYDLCKNVDLSDIPFIALSIDLDIPLWTGDKKLKEGLKSKGFTNFYNP